MPHNPVLLEKHHMIPKSRGGKAMFHKTNNIKWVSPKVHLAWHNLWGNATPYEIQKILMSGNYQIPDHLYGDWIIVFGPYASPAEAAMQVYNEWTPLYLHDDS